MTVHRLRRVSSKVTTKATGPLRSGHKLLYLALCGVFVFSCQQQALQHTQQRSQSSEATTIQGSSSIAATADPKGTVPTEAKATEKMVATPQGGEAMASTEDATKRVLHKGGGLSPEQTNKVQTALAEDVAKKAKVKAQAKLGVKKGNRADTTSGTSAPATTMKTTTFQGDGFVVTVKSPDQIARGSRGKATVRVTPQAGWKMNQDFPAKISLSAPSGVQPDKTVYTKSDASKFVDKEAVFPIGLDFSEAGDKQVSAKFKFAICTDVTCEPKRQNLAWNVSVR